MAKISASPSPRTFAEAVAENILAPAAEKAAGADGVLDTSDASRIDALDGLDAHARALLKEAAALTGTSAPTVAAFVTAATDRVKRDAAAAAGADGRLSSTDAAALPADLRLAYFALRGAGDPLTIPARPGVSFSEAVVRDVCARYGLTDAGALLDQALRLDDGNLYLNRRELEAAAKALNAAPADRPLSFSEAVLTRVMSDFGISDRAALLALAARFDADGNRYLKRSELEAAAKVLVGRGAEIGVVSDIDKTVLPPTASGAPLKDPYPGVATLFRILESRLDGTGAKGDVHYVTARDPSSASEIPAWLDLHRMPRGPIDTGTSPLPWIAESEKVRDIEAIFEATGNQKYVLFGDTNHRDPEVYKRIREKYPARVLAIVIHNVKAADAARTAGMHVVDNYAVAAAKLLQDGVLDEASARAVMDAAQIEGLPITDAEIEELVDDHRPG
ncbi:MAG: DUF2183 domain-containing protein [Deltaproteobacteria bacterium]|nr:DUF2183 domain-containing protein [Deltaproteobacteria bacterium]